MPIVRPVKQVPFFVPDNPGRLLLEGGGVEEVGQRVRPLVRINDQIGSVRLVVQVT